MKFLPIILCLLWLEIDNPPWHYGIRLRVMDSEAKSGSDVYRVQRSTDGGRSWSDYRLTTNGEWFDVQSTLPSALFRAARR